MWCTENMSYENCVGQEEVTEIFNSDPLSKKVGTVGYTNLASWKDDFGKGKNDFQFAHPGTPLSFYRRTGQRSGNNEIGLLSGEPPYMTSSNGTNPMRRLEEMFQRRTTTLAMSATSENSQLKNHAVVNSIPITTGLAINQFIELSKTVNDSKETPRLSSPVQAIFNRGVDMTGKQEIYRTTDLRPNGQIQGTIDLRNSTKQNEVPSIRTGIPNEKESGSSSVKITGTYEIKKIPGQNGLAKEIKMFDMEKTSHVTVPKFVANHGPRILYTVPTLSSQTSTEDSSKYMANNQYSWLPNGFNTAALTNSSSRAFYTAGLPTSNEFQSKEFQGMSLLKINQRPKQIPGANPATSEITTLISNLPVATEIKIIPRTEPIKFKNPDGGFTPQRKQEFIKNSIVMVDKEKHQRALYGNNSTSPKEMSATRKRKLNSLNENDDSECQIVQNSTRLRPISSKLKEVPDSSEIQLPPSIKPITPYTVHSTPDILPLVSQNGRPLKQKPSPSEIDKVVKIPASDPYCSWLLKTNEPQRLETRLLLSYCVPNHNNRGFFCPDCGRKTPDYEAACRHAVSEHKLEIECECLLCNGRFSWLTDLSLHMLFVHTKHFSKK